MRSTGTACVNVRQLALTLLRQILRWTVHSDASLECENGANGCFNFLPVYFQAFYCRYFFLCSSFSANLRRIPFDRVACFSPFGLRAETPYIFNTPDLLSAVTQGGGAFTISAGLVHPESATSQTVSQRGQIILFDSVLRIGRSISGVIQRFAYLRKPPGRTTVCASKRLAVPYLGRSPAYPSHSRRKLCILCV